MSRRKATTLQRRPCLRHNLDVSCVKCIVNAGVDAVPRMSLVPEAFEEQTCNAKTEAVSRDVEDQAGEGSKIRRMHEGKGWHVQRDGHSFWPLHHNEQKERTCLKRALL